MALVGLLAVVLAGCLPGQSTHRPLPIPAGAQQVDVVLTKSGLILDPATVPAGNVYFVLDNDVPAGGYRLVTFVQQGAGVGEASGSLPRVDSNMLALCTVDQYYWAVRARDGALGYCGAEVVRATMGEGKYTFVIRGEVVLNDTGDGSPYDFIPSSDGEPPTAVLEVVR